MATTRIELHGLQELGERLRKLAGPEAQKAARAAALAAAQVVRKSATAKAPVLTGNLRKNIIVKRLPKTQTRLTEEYIVTVRQGKLTSKQKAKGIDDAFYAKFVEFGTVKAPPKPFLRPAFEENKGAAIDVMTDKLRQRITKAGG